MAMDSNGSLNFELLEQELNASIGKDEERKRVDDMKKRAVHMAGSYDEFRHMVSCAHLKPVTRKEMDSLGDVKRGWSRANFSGTSSSSMEKGRRRKVKGDGKRKGKKEGFCLTDGVPQAVPTTMSEFHRDWQRRCKTDAEKRSYLGLIAAPKLAEVCAVELDPGVLEEIIQVLYRGYKEGVMPGICGEGTKQELATAGLQWLGALTEVGRFRLSVSFFDGDQLAQVEDFLSKLEADLGPESSGEIAHLQERYRGKMPPAK